MVLGTELAWHVLSATRSVGFANALHVNVVQPEFGASPPYSLLREEHTAPLTLPQTARVQHQVRTLAGIRSGPGTLLSFTQCSLW